jgi:ketosteroid isomerase-like protein
MTDALNKWMSAYRAAWESNAPDDIAALFTPDGKYFKEPFTPPAVGRDAITAMWLEHQDGPGSTTFTWTPLVETGDVAIVQGETVYSTVTYSNLWVIRLAPSGEAAEFTEWWMDQSQPS